MPISFVIEPAPSKGVQMVFVELFFIAILPCAHVLSASPSLNHLTLILLAKVKGQETERAGSTGRLVLGSVLAAYQIKGMNE